MRQTRHPVAPIALLVAASLIAACATSGASSLAPAATALTPTTAPDAPASSPPDEALGGRPPAGAVATADPATPLPSAPASTPSSTVEPGAARPAPAEPFALNLYEDGDYVRQYTFEWCVGASIQMTLALTDTSHDMSRARQQQLWERARDLSDSPFGGANPKGWVPTLNELGVGPYRLVSEPTVERAVARAAAAIVDTGRPVGLVMWRGRHAWMMSGFESLGDPAAGSDFRVTGVRVLDPLYPHGSEVWGPSPKPNALLSVEELGRQFVARTSGRINLGVAPGYLLVLPVEA